jgi:hypothetical protein
VTPKVKKRRQPARRIRASTPADAARQVIQKKVAPKISKKINYAALDELFDLPA